MTRRRIILAVDTGPASDAAVRWVAARCGGIGTSADIVSVATDDDRLLTEAQAAVAAARDLLLTSAPGATVTTSVPRGNVVDVLEELSESADLLVVGSDRSGALRTFLHAGLPMRLTGRLRCTLVVVPRLWNGDAGTSVAVGWDDDHAAGTAIETAATEAEALGLPLHIHHVWRPVAVSHYDLSGGASLISAIEEAERLALARIVRETIARHPRLEVSGELHLGSGGGGILGYASQASLIVVGSHDRSMLGEIVAGATGDDLIARSDRIPVMVTAPDDGRSRGGR